MEGAGGDETAPLNGINSLRKKIISNIRMIGWMGGGGDNEKLCAVECSLQFNGLLRLQCLISKPVLNPLGYGVSSHGQCIYTQNFGVSMSHTPEKIYRDVIDTKYTGHTPWYLNCKEMHNSRKERVLRIIQR